MTENAKSIPPRIHRHTLVEMNRAVSTARRDAAHSHVLELLQHDLTGRNEARKQACYGCILRLLEEALAATKRSQIQQDSPLIHYFRLLRETVKAQVALITHEIRLGQEVREFTPLLGDDAVEKLTAVRKLFRSSERNVLNSINDLLKFGEPILARDSENRMGLFSEDDRRRYDLALREFTAYYSGWCVEQKCAAPPEEEVV